MLIIDADLYVYKAGFAHRGKEIGFKLIHRDTSEEIDLGNRSLTQAREHCGINGYSKDEWKLVHYNNPTPLEHTLGNLNSMIESLLSKYPEHEYKMFLTTSDHSNYRYNVATIQPYKGSRSKCVKCFEKCKARFDKNKNVLLNCKYCGDIDKECTFADKPHYYNEIRDHLVRRWNAEMVHNQEADDAVSIMAMDNQACHERAIMVHIDKDINNTPGWHFNPDKDLEYCVSREEALRNFYTQFLLGDNIDCIPGVPGVGPVTAKELLKDCVTKEDYEHIILYTYVGHDYEIKRFKNTMNLTYEEAFDRLTEVGQLLHIRQYEDELWIPTITLA